MSSPLRASSASTRRSSGRSRQRRAAAVDARPEHVGAGAGEIPDVKMFPGGHHDPAAGCRTRAGAHRGRRRGTTIAGPCGGRARRANGSRRLAGSTPHSSRRARRQGRRSRPPAGCTASRPPHRQAMLDVDRRRVDEGAAGEASRHAAVVGEHERLPMMRPCARRARRCCRGTNSRAAPPPDDETPM